jgi:hypothetical protein
MRTKYRILTVIALYSIVILFYITFFLYRIESAPLFIILTVGSAAVLSTSTIYTVIQSKTSQDQLIKEKKIPGKIKKFNTDEIQIIEDYFDALPIIEEYVESGKSYKDITTLDKIIFTIFSKDELNKINLLNLPKMDYFVFLRELIYYNPNERMALINSMLLNREKIDKDIVYIPPNKSMELGEKLRVYVRSLLEPGEKTKLMIIDADELVSSIKQKVAILFDYNQVDFLLSSGGILLDEDSLIKEYDIDDDDEIALIPIRKKKT